MFILSFVFVIIGLGKCIVYYMINWFGSIILCIGYVSMFLDLLLFFVILLNIVCVGGIVFLIMNSVVVVLGLDFEKLFKLVGCYLMMNVYMLVKIILYIFLIVMVLNVLVFELMLLILGIKLNWVEWFLVVFVLGLLCLFIILFICYIIVKFELK